MRVISRTVGILPMAISLQKVIPLRGATLTAHGAGPHQLFSQQIIGLLILREC